MTKIIQCAKLLSDYIAGLMDGTNFKQNMLHGKKSKLSRKGFVRNLWREDEFLRLQQLQKEMVKYKTNREIAV